MSSFAQRISSAATTTDPRSMKMGTGYFILRGGRLPLLALALALNPNRNKLHVSDGHIVPA